MVKDRLTEEMERLIADVREFFEEKNIKIRVDKIKGLVKPPHKNYNGKQKLSNDSVIVLDSLTGIGEVI